jgi:hypothetical protein
VHEGEVLIRVTLPTDAEPAELVQPGEAALDHPTLSSQAGAVRFPAASDQRVDAPGSQLVPVLVVIVGAVGEQQIGTPARATDPAGDRRDAIDQGKELGDVVAIAGGEGDRQRQPAGVCQQVVL